VTYKTKKQYCFRRKAKWFFD